MRLWLCLIIALNANCFAANSTNPSSPLAVVQAFFALAKAGDLCGALEYVDPEDLREINGLVIKKVETDRRVTPEWLKKKFGRKVTWRQAQQLAPHEFFCRVEVPETFRSKKYGGSQTAMKPAKLIEELFSNMQFIGVIQESRTLAHVIARVQVTSLGIAVEDIATTVLRDGRWFMLLDQSKKLQMKARHGAL